MLSPSPRPTIGEPETRFREDPIRILRAIKFASRLDFEIDTVCWEAMVRTSEDIARCSGPRVTEELYRLTESGHAARAFTLMADCGALAVMLPEVAEYMSAHREAYLAHLNELDRAVAAHRGLPREFVLSLIYLPSPWRSSRAPMT